MQSFVLTQDDLIVIRAALRFWQDENGADPGLLEIYSEATDRVDESALDVAGLSSRLQRVGLRYLICCQPDLTPATDRMYSSAVLAANDATGQDEIVATVLVAEST